MQSFRSLSRLSWQRFGEWNANLNVPKRSFEVKNRIDFPSRFGNERRRAAKGGRDRETDAENDLGEARAPPTPGTGGGGNALTHRRTKIPVEEEKHLEEALWRILWEGFGVIGGAWVPGNVS